MLVMCSSSCALRHVLVVMCSSSCARRHVLFVMCSSSCALRRVLFVVCSSSCALHHVLFVMCSSSCALRHVLFGVMCSSSCALRHVLVVCPPVTLLVAESEEEEHLPPLRGPVVVKINSHGFLFNMKSDSNLKARLFLLLGFWS